MFRPWVKQSLDSNRSNQVLLVPLGGIPAATFARAVSILKRLEAIPMQDLTAPGSWTRQSSALQQLSWSESCFKFHFIDMDTIDGGLSEWGDLQAHRRVGAAIGIVHAPSCEGTSLGALDKELTSLTASYVHVSVRRIFVFEHSFDAGAMPGFDAAQHVILPPEPEGLELAESSRLMERFLCEPLYNVAVTLIVQFDAQVKSYQAALGGIASKVSQFATSKPRETLPSLTTPADAASGGDVKAEKKAKRKWPRLRKWIGDLCLLAGSPKDALEAYDAAILELKSDPTWLAAALEGSAAALAALNDWEHPSSLPEELYRMIAKDVPTEAATGGSTRVLTWLVVERCNEALRRMSECPGLALLELELCFKLARFHSANPIEVPAALECLLRALSIPDMGMQAQVERSIEAAMLCSSMGLKRKAALFTHLASLQCAEYEQWDTSHQLACFAAHVYGVDMRHGTTSVDDRPSTAQLPQADQKKSGAEKGDKLSNHVAKEKTAQTWIVLRKRLIHSALEASMHCGDATASASYYAELMRVTAALEGERKSADDKMYFLPAPPSADIIMQAHTPRQANGVAAPTQDTSLTLSSLTENPSDAFGRERLNWSERMLRRSDNKITSDLSQHEKGLSRSLHSPSSRVRADASGLSNEGTSASMLSRRSRRVTMPKSIKRRVRRATEVMGGGRPPPKALEEDPATSIIAFRAAAPAEDLVDLLDEVAQCLARLPPGVRIALPGIPLLKSALPLHLPSHMMPVTQCPLKGDAAAGDGGTGFFYSPFQEIRKGEGGRRPEAAAVSAARWVVGEKSQVRARFSNPLSVELPVDLAKAIVDDESRVHCYPVSFRLPPHVLNYQVILHIKPLEEGKVMLRGVRVDTLGMSTDCYVRDDGSAIEPESVLRGPWSFPFGSEGGKEAQDHEGNPCDEAATTAVELLPAMPGLSLSFASEAVPISAVLPGERRTFSVMLTNRGSVDIGDMEIWLRRTQNAARDVRLFCSKQRCTDRAADDVLESGRVAGYSEKETTVSCDTESLFRQLRPTWNGSDETAALCDPHLPPAGNLLIHFALEAGPHGELDGSPGESISAKVVVKYAEAPLSPNARHLTLPLSVRIIRGLRILGIRAVPPLHDRHAVNIPGTSADSDARTCVVAVDLANDGPAPMRVVPCGSSPSIRQLVSNASSSSHGILVPRFAHATLLLSIARLRVDMPELEVPDKDDEEPRSPLAPPPPRRWQMKLLPLIAHNLSLDWTTDGEYCDEMDSGSSHLSDGGDILMSSGMGRAGRLDLPLNLLDDAGRVRQPGSQALRKKTPSVVPSCFKSVILPPVRLSVLPHRHPLCCRVLANAGFPTMVDGEEYLGSSWIARVSEHSIVPVTVAVQNLSECSTLLASLEVYAHVREGESWSPLPSEDIAMSSMRIVWSGSLSAPAEPVIPGGRRILSITARFRAAGEYAIGVRASWPATEGFVSHQVQCHSPLVVVVESLRSFDGKGAHDRDTVPQVECIRMATSPVAGELDASQPPKTASARVSRRSDSPIRDWLTHGSGSRPIRSRSITPPRALHSSSQSAHLV